MRPLLLSTALLSAWATAGAQSFGALATQTATVLSDGPRKGDTGQRFLNVEGKEKGKYASYAVLRFDAAPLKRDAEKKLGAGKFAPGSITLELAQSNASFTSDGSVTIYYSADNGVDITSAGKLKYPYDPKGALQGAPVATVRFGASPRAPAGAAPPSAKVDRFSLPRTAATQPLYDAVAAGKVVTLVLAEADGRVAATWAGEKPAGKRPPPTLVVQASGRP